MSGNQPLGGSDDGGVIAKTGQPVHGRLFAELGELALSVAACGLRNRFRGGSESDGAFEVRPQLAVPDEVERLGVEWNAAAHEPAGIEHCVNALLDVTVQHIAGRLQADLDWSVTFQASAARLMDLSEGTPCEQAHLNGLNHLGTIARPDVQGRFGIETPQATIQVLDCVCPHPLPVARKSSERAGVSPSPSRRARRKSPVLNFHFDSSVLFRRVVNGHTPIAAPQSRSLRQSQVLGQSRRFVPRILVPGSGSVSPNPHRDLSGFTPNFGPYPRDQVPFGKAVAPSGVDPYGFTTPPGSRVLPPALTVYL